MKRYLVLALVALVPVCAQTPSFAKDIAPMLQSRCAGCHEGKVKMGSLDTDSYESLMRGGNNGAIIVPGKSEESRLYLMLTGKVSPGMPMDGTQLPPAQIQTVKRWIDGGAPGPTAAEAAALRRAIADVKPPVVKPRVPVKPQIFALAWRPDGGQIALGGFREVKLSTPGAQRHTATFTGHADVVRSIAYSHDGKSLAAAGGVPGAKGEVKIWDVERGMERLTIQGHDDCIYAVVFSPDGKSLVTSSYDKLIKVWDVDTGRELRTLKDHIDAVYALAFTPDGKRLISGSADRTVKVWDPTTGTRLYTLSDALDGIHTVAVDPSGKFVAAGGLDKSVRIWSLGQTGGELVHSLMAHEDAILKLSWSPDGKTLVSSSADRTVKVLDAATLAEKRSLPAQSEWAYAVDYSPDGKSLAIGRLDGSLTVTKP